MDLFKNQSKFKDSSLAVYQTVCEVLDGYGWVYDKDESNLSTELIIRGDDLHLDLKVRVDDKMDAVVLISRLPFNVPNEKRPLLAFAVNMVNASIFEGGFDINVKRGNISYRCASFFTGSIVSKEMIAHLIEITLGTVDDYNDKFFLLFKDKMDLSELNDFINQ